jgi:F-type H+-transporting ATPase subunit delta
MAASDIIAVRYAQAYFDLAAEDKAIDKRREALAIAAERLGSAEVTAVMNNPKVERQAKVAVAEDILQGVETTARNLVRLLIERGRLGLLPQILEAYDRLADRASGRVRADVITAVPLDREQERNIRAELAQRLGGDVQITVKQDPAIIGGLVIRIGDRVIDGSVRTRLQELQAALA